MADLSEGHAELAQLLLHPCFWTPKLICSFFTEVYLHLIENKNTKQQFGNLSDALNLKAKEREILGPNGDWKEVLGECHYLILTARYDKSKRGKSLPKYNSCLISDLITVIRHKDHHFADIPEKEKTELGWQDTTEATKHCVYAQYWISKFPKLLPFLWVELYDCLRQSSQTYAGFSSEQEIQKIPVGVDGLIQSLQNALWNDLQKGVVEKVFISETGPVIVIEVRIITSDLVSNVLSRNCSLVIEFSNSQMEVQWNNQATAEQLTYHRKVSDNLHHILIVTNNSDYVKNEVIKKSRDLSKIILVTSNIRNFPALALRYSQHFNISFHEIPICWKNLSVNTRAIAAQKCVTFQSKVVPLANILPANDDQRNFILSKLNGQALVSLLKNQKPKMFSKCQFPPPPEIYLERTIIERIVVSPEYISAKLHSTLDIFIICGISFEMAKRVFPIAHCSKKVQYPLQIGFNKDNTKYDFPDLLTVQILIIQVSVQCTTDLFDNIKNKIWYHKNNIHLLDYKDDNTLHWLGTKGDTSILQGCSEFLLKVSNSVQETELLDVIPPHAKLIFINGKPGMGKSVMLIKLAEYMQKRRCQSLVFLINPKEFASKLKTISASKEALIRVFQEHICETDFERELINHCLSTKSSSFRLEVLFDGLDELTLASRATIIKLLKDFHITFPSVCVWATMRDYMVEEMGVQIPAIHLEIRPFSREQRGLYFVWFWTIFIESKDPASNIENLIAQVELFEKRCANFEILVGNVQSTGNPLLCYLVARFEAEHVLHGNVTKHSPPTRIKLYQNIIDDAQKTYLRKNGMYNKDLDIIDEFSEQISLVHIYFAFKLIVSDNAATSLKKTFEFNVSDKIHKIILSFGLIENLEPLRFMHGTFAEYLVALFFHRVLRGKYNHILSTETKKNNILKYLWNEVIEVCDGKGIPGLKNQSVAYFLDSLLECDIATDKSVACIKETGYPYYKLKLNVSNIKWIRHDFYHWVTEWNETKFANLYEVYITEILPFRHLFCVAVQIRQDKWCSQLMKKLTLKHKHTWISFSQEHVLPRGLYGKKMELRSFFEYVLKSYICNFPNFVSVLLEVKPTAELITFFKYIVANSLCEEVETEVRNNLDKTPLQLLMEQGNMRQDGYLELVKFLVEHMKANVHVKTKRGDTLLHILATRAGSCHEVINSTYSDLWNFLIQNGCNPEEANKQGETPFHVEKHFVEVNKNFYMFEEYLNSESVANFIDEDKYTLLHMVLERDGSPFVLVQKLLDLGGDVNLPDHLNRTPVILAAKLGKTNILNAIMAHADATGQNIELDNRVLFNAILSDSTEMMEFLLQNNVDIFRTAPNGQNTLHVAVKEKKNSIVKYLLSKKPSMINSVEKHGESALHMAVKTRNVQIMEFLLASNANASLEDMHKNTPLHTAINGKSVEVILILLAAGANIYKLNAKDQCAVYLALERFETLALRHLICEESRLPTGTECECSLHVYVRQNERTLLKALSEVSIVETTHAICGICNQHFAQKCFCTEKTYALIYMCYKMNDQLHLVNKALALLLKRARKLRYFFDAIMLTKYVLRLKNV